MSPVSFDTLTMVRLYSPSRSIPDAPHGCAFSLDAHDNGLQPMPLEGGLKPAPAGRLRRVGSSITSAASHAARSTPCRPFRIAAAHTTIMTEGVRLPKWRGRSQKGPPKGAVTIQNAAILDKILFIGRPQALNEHHSHMGRAKMGFLEVPTCHMLIRDFEKLPSRQFFFKQTENAVFSLLHFQSFTRSKMAGLPCPAREPRIFRGSLYFNALSSKVAVFPYVVGPEEPPTH